MDLTRNEPRDIFDIWFIFQRTEKFDFNFKRICEIFNEKYGFPPSFKTLWETRLSKQLAVLPEIETVIKYIANKLEILFKEQIK